ncbi:MAG: aspartate 1-decarboxylase [Candidatus Omnitrophica bacterium]|nr:aspartate 1-decarboxylase [Candidatus Omnitrophota bacterium]
MMRTICKSKLHRAVVTDANVNYTGSLTLDAQLMKAANILPYEQVHVVDVDNGARIVTYCIEGQAGSGTVCINGAAARLITVGDRVIIMSYAQLTEQEVEAFSPTVIMVDAGNRIRDVVRERCRFLEETAGNPSRRS